MISYAQNFEDVMLARAFKEQITGFYIDIGVWDATIDSVTKHFYDKGWSGVNIEPLPDNYQQIAAARPRDINLNVAVSNHHGSLLFHHVEGTGLSTSCREYAHTHAEKGFQVSELTVPTKTLKEICANHAASVTIDFLKVDVEGAEADVIKSGDWNTYRPRIVLVEATAPNSPLESFTEWEPVLLEHGYKFVYFDGLNRFYYREEEPHLLDYFRVPPNVFDEFVLYRTMALETKASQLEARLKSAMKKADKLDRVRRTLFGRIVLHFL